MMIRIAHLMILVWLPLIWLMWMLLLLFVAGPLLFVRAFFKALSESFAEYPCVIINGYKEASQIARGAFTKLMERDDET